jgi:WD40 repeat protein
MGAPPPPLRRRTQALSPGVEAILQIALAKDPRQRYESVRAFTQTLAACMNPVATVPASPNGKTMPDTSLPMAPPTMLVPPQPGMVQLPPDKKKQPQALFRVSRRTLLRDVLAGTGGTVALAAIEGLVYWRLHLPPPTPIYVYRGHTDAVQMVKWSPDGTTIASGGNDKRILVWRADMKSASRAAWGTGVTVYGGHSDIIRDLAWSSSGKYIASASDDMTVQIWDATNSQNVLTYRKHPGHVYGVAWSNDDKLIISGGSDRSVQIWNTQTGGIIATYLADNNVQKVAWSPDNKQIAVATADRVDILNFANGKLNYLLTYSGHGGLTVDQVAWSPNGQELASASSDQTMRVWDARTATTVFSSPAFNNSVWGVAWSPNSQYLAAASKDKSLQVWQMANGTWNRIVTNGANNFITSVNWSPNSRYYAAGVFDATVQIWDLTQE